MATVVKDFKIKSGLIVEGTSATVNNYAVLTKNPADQTYITELVGGSGESANIAESLVLRDANGDFAAGTITAETGFSGDLTGDVTGNVTGNVTGTVSDISNHDTDDVAEGVTNLYFTDARAQSAMAGLYDPAGSASAAQTAAESYADQAELDAIASANSYTDGEISTLDTSLKAYADTAESDAVTTANAYTDARETAITSAYQAYSDQSEADAKTYADAAVAALVDGAPALLDTLNELAAAIADDESFSATVVSDIATGVQTAKDYADSQDALQTTSLQAYADTAEADAIASANNYTDGEIATVNSTISALDTDDVAEGTNLYYTTSRGQTDAASLLTGATLTNIQITGDGNGLTITAENGVADSTTDDLVEGSTNLYFSDERAQDAVAAAIAAGTQTNITVTYDDVANTLSFVAENGVADSTTDDLTEGSSNLYFTDARAVSALEAVVPNFTEVDINSVATQVAATQTVATASQVVGYSFDSGSYKSAKFLVKVDEGTHTEVSEVLVTLDSSNNIAITEFAVVGTNGSLSTITAGMNGTDVELLVTTANNNSDVTVSGTLLV